MKLSHLYLKDFRQFLGEHKVLFADDDTKNVTVFHGFNGSGKTALLNAFIWVLYGQTTPDLEEPNRMFNEAAGAALAPGGNSEFFVEVKFSDYQGEVYVARRTAIVKRSDDGKIVQLPGELLLGVHRKSGEYQKLDAAQLYVNRHLPESLYPFFFFNGERVEKLAGKNAYDQVESGVKTLLNVEIFERAVDHLRGTVTKELSKELKAFGDTELSDKIAEREKLENDRTIVINQLTMEKSNVARCEEEVEKIDQKQQSIVHLSALIERRGGVEKQIISTKAEIAGCEEDLKKVLSTTGYLAFADGVLAKTQELVAEARQRGDLPAKLKPQFVDDLLTEAKCICGRSIEKGSAEDAALREWRKQTGLAELQEAILLTSGAVGVLQSRRSDFYERVDGIRQRQDQLIALRLALRDQRAEVKDQIGERSLDEESVALEEQRSKAMGEKTESQHRGKELEAQRNEIEKHLTECMRVEAALELQDEKAKVVKGQLESVQRVAAALDEICELQKQEVRKSLDSQVSDIWTDAAVKDYKASVSQDFRLELHKQVRGKTQPVHGASTGEKQVLALSFVGALVRRAKKNAERSKDSKNTTNLIVGDNYPLVMDSPFGSLEPDYQKKIAEWIPTLASQVVVMVSRSQWSSQIDNAFRGRIGKEYILELHTPKEGTAQVIKILDKERPYVVETNNQFENTEIQEVV